MGGAGRIAKGCFFQKGDPGEPGGIGKKGLGSFLKKNNQSGSMKNSIKDVGGLERSRKVPGFGREEELAKKSSQVVRKSGSRDPGEVTLFFF
jgi:hypothetical protein